MSLEDVFPNLGTMGFEETSDATSNYNCIAWASGEDSRWWWPDPNEDYHWPAGVPRSDTIDAFIAALQTLGYLPCLSDQPEQGFEKVALYGMEGRVRHAARQLLNGKWTSKLGSSIDIEHSLDGVVGHQYGRVMIILKRPFLPH